MDLKLKALKREKNEKLSKDEVAAVVYGKGIASQSLKVNKIEFDKIFTAAGESNLIKLDYGDGSLNVLVKDIQKDVVKNTVSHIDFYQVNMKEKINAEIPLHFEGESKAVKELGGSLIKEAHEVKVECLPGDLVDHIVVDISVLDSFDDLIKVADLNIPKGMELLTEPDVIVAMIAAPKAQEEEPVVAAPVESTPSESQAETEKKE